MDEGRVEIRPASRLRSSYSRSLAFALRSFLLLSGGSLESEGDNNQADEDSL